MHKSVDIVDIISDGLALTASHIRPQGVTVYLTHGRKKSIINHFSAREMGNIPLIAKHFLNASH